MRDVEERLVASMLLDCDCIPHVVKVLTHRDLSDELGSLYQVVTGLYDRDGLVVLESLVKELTGQHAGLVHRLGGLPEVCRMLTSLCTPALVLQYAKELRVASIDHQFQDNLDAIDAMADASPSAVAARLESMSELMESKARAQGASSGRSRPKCLVGNRDVRAKVRRRIDATDGQTGWPTGWSSLDNLIGGWRPSETTALTAPTGAGKTTLANQAAIYQRLHEGRRVLYCPFEGGALQALPKLFKQLTGEDARKVSIAQYDNAIETLGDDTKWILLDHIGAIEIGQWRRVLRWAIEVARVEFVVVDHLHFMVERHDPDLYAKLAQIAADTVAITAASLAHTLLLVQAKKNDSQGANKDDYIPQLGDIRGLGSMSQDMPNALSLYRPRKRDRTPHINSDGTYGAMLLCTKCRDGAGTEGNIELRFNRERELFWV